MTLNRGLGMEANALQGMITFLGLSENVFNKFLQDNNEKHPLFGCH